MVKKLDKHVYMTIAEVCSDLQPFTGFSNLDYNLKHFQELVKTDDYSDSRIFKTFLGVIIPVLSKVYGFNDARSIEYFIKFLKSDRCLKFGEVAYLMKYYDPQLYGNDRFIKKDNHGRMVLNF